MTIEKCKNMVKNCNESRTAKLFMLLSTHKEKTDELDLIK